MSEVRISRALRQKITEQARHRCGYCLTSEFVVGAPMEIDHIIPLSLGGPTEESNLWLACSLCNEYKANRVAAIDPQTDEMVLLFNPRLDKWSEHFAWNSSADRMVGLTPVGRATVIALNVNRPSLVRARQAWTLVGWHPPND
jgi:5-methylcytosine-specific restriction endonuclease McrA